jgi:hypothetical protein
VGCCVCERGGGWRAAQAKKRNNTTTEVQTAVSADMLARRKDSFTPASFSLAPAFSHGVLPQPDAGGVRDGVAGQLREL